MNSTKYSFIFDLDGTLYPFDKGRSECFSTSRFQADLKRRALSFIADKLNLEPSTALKKYSALEKQYNGEIGRALNTEYRISREEYFTSVWNLNPDDYVEKNKKLIKLLKNIKNPLILLTSSPNIWAYSALNFLEIKDAFGDFIFTCESNLHRPKPQLFLKIASDLGIATKFVFSIGDQEESDILPAKKIGMPTFRIGKNAKTEADFQAPNILSALKLLKNKGYLEYEL
jgi:HAD superfamily hydrolase (TIGR01549 family)